MKFSLPFRAKMGNLGHRLVEEKEVGVGSVEIWTTDFKTARKNKLENFVINMEI